jgi:hypothetical protein
MQPTIKKSKHKSAMNLLEVNVTRGSISSVVMLLEYIYGHQEMVPRLNITQRDVEGERRKKLKLR